jgi:hypothetical protein
MIYYIHKVKTPLGNDRLKQAKTGKRQQAVTLHKRIELIKTKG